MVSSYGGYKSDTGITGSEWSSYLPQSRDEGSLREFSVRLICTSANIGGVIGKGGFVIKQIRQDSGAQIKVDSSTVEDDCIISISSREVFLSFFLLNS